MAVNYILSLQPTFTQGLVLGQLSIVILLGLVLKYLFLDSSQNIFETDADPSSRKRKLDLHVQGKDVIADSETTQWFNILLKQILDVYRSKLRDDLPGFEGDEIARKRIEDYANKIRPAGFLDHITVHSVDLGVSAPTLYSARIKQKQPTSSSDTEFDAIYTDTLSLSLSTSYLFNYPMSSFARLPISLTISLSQFRSSICISPPIPNAVAPMLSISISPNFTLDLSTSSLMGSRAKLANVPKLHELIQHQVRRALAARATWNVVLPGLASVAEGKEEVKKELLEMHHTP